MTEIISSIIPYIPSSAIPLVVCVCFYFFIQSKRKETAKERDKDSQDIHDKLLRHEFDIGALKDDKNLVHTIQTDLQEQVNQLTTAVAKLSVSVEQFSEAVKELRNEIKDLRK